MAIQDYITSTNEVSFSQIVDRTIIECGRPTQIATVVAYVNTTIRELQRLARFADDLYEDQLTATAQPHIWDEIPSGFRKMKTVHYTLTDTYPVLRRPQRNITEHEGYYYRASDYFVFQGVLLSEPISIAYYKFARKFSYQKRLGAALTGSADMITRQAYFDTDEETWYYLNDAGDAYVTTINDTVEEAARREKAANWLIRDWAELVLEGSKNKLWNSVGDERARGSYSLYKSQQNDLIATAAHEGIELATE